MLLGTQDRDFFPKDLVEKLTFAKEMGFECFEIDGKVLMEQKDELKEESKSLGFRYLLRVADIVAGLVTL